MTVVPDPPGEPDLPPGELDVVFGRGRPDRADFAVGRVYEPVASASLGIWRIGAGDRTAVLKLVAHAEGTNPHWRSGEDPSHWYYWRREALAYESGLLSSLGPALRAPATLRVADRTDGSVALWLEDLSGPRGTDWGVDRHARAAHHLGRMQGAFLDAPEVFAPAWMSRGWLRDYLSGRDGDIALAADRDVWDLALLRHHLPDPPVAAVQDAWAAVPALLAALDGVPRTLCHHDFHSANLFEDGDDTTAVVDWAFVGDGAIGEDAATLVADAVLDFFIEPALAGALYEAVVDEYGAGLRASGWRGDGALVRGAVAGCIAAKYAWIAPAMVRAVHEERPLLNRRPIDDALAVWAPAVQFILARTDEARRLLLGT